MSAATLARAIELDDNAPDDVCPGCKADITGWQGRAKHYLGTPGAAARWARWTVGVEGRLCVWDHDYLLARQFRRQLIRGERT